MRDDTAGCVVHSLSAVLRKLFSVATQKKVSSCLKFMALPGHRRQPISKAVFLQTVRSAKLERMRDTLGRRDRWVL
jgi:hypothetical protein